MPLIEEVANPDRVQEEVKFALRSLLGVALPRYEVVSGGHPSIMDVVYDACIDAGDRVRLKIFQSDYFLKEGSLSEFALKLQNFVIPVEKISEKPLVNAKLVQERMTDYLIETYPAESLATFYIGGKKGTLLRMPGVKREYRLLKKKRPTAFYPVYQIEGVASHLPGRPQVVEMYDRNKYSEEYFQQLLEQHFNPESTDNMSLRKKLERQASGSV